MAVENILECPSHMRGRGFALLDPSSVPVRHLAITDTVTVAKGDCLQDDTAGGAKLAITSSTVNGITFETFLGIAAEAGLGATASNAKLAIWLVSARDLIWAPVENDGSSLSASDSGEVFDLESESGLDHNDTSFGTLSVGFHCIAVDTTNDYMLGRFIRGAS